MEQRNRYGITTREELMQRNREQYLVTASNRKHWMGGVSLELPTDAYRMPYEAGSGNSMYVWSNTNGVESTLFCERIDEDIDDILRVAHFKSRTREVCGPCARKRYIINLLKPCEGEIVVCRNRFAYKGGGVYMLTSAPTAAMSQTTSLCYIAYQAVFFLKEIGKGPGVRLQHTLAAHSYFCNRVYECKEMEDLSQLLYDTLGTIDFVPDRLLVDRD
jgi:hypothetical protein